ncbi:MAG: hypothetical protein JNM52_03870, partial [Betaproteobacteria bacterium]|nr:hypothetical protein [Betaproteobacteria bacterium]
MADSPQATITNTHNMKSILKRISLALLILIGLALTLTGIEYIGGQPMGLFAGSRPDGLGYNNGQF